MVRLMTTEQFKKIEKIVTRACDISFSEENLRKIYGLECSLQDKIATTIEEIVSRNPSDHAYHVNPSGDCPRTVLNIIAAMRYLKLTSGEAQKILDQEKFFENKIKEIFQELVSIKLLSNVSTVEVPAVEHFSVEDDIYHSSDTMIKTIGKKFRIIFGAKYTEKNVPAVTLKISKLNVECDQGPIINELGGVKKIGVPLAHLIRLVTLQPHNQYLTTGKLTNNTIFITDSNQEPYSDVYVSWEEDGWFVNCGSWTSYFKGCHFITPA